MLKILNLVRDITINEISLYQSNDKPALCEVI